MKRRACAHCGGDHPYAAHHDVAVAAAMAVIAKAWGDPSADSWCEVVRKLENEQQRRQMARSGAEARR